MQISKEHINWWENLSSDDKELLSIAYFNQDYLFLSDSDIRDIYHLENFNLFSDDSKNKLRMSIDDRYLKVGIFITKKIDVDITDLDEKIDINNLKHDHIIRQLNVLNILNEMLLRYEYNKDEK